MYTQNNTSSQQDDISLSIEQPEKQIWWEKKGFIAASIFSVVWLAFIWDFLFFSGWWASRHSLSPAEFIGGISGLFFPILISFMVSSYFDRTNQISYEAQTIRSYLNELIYPSNSNAVYTKSLTGALKDQVKEFKKIHQDVLEATKNLNNEISTWINGLENSSKQLEDKTGKSLKALTKSIDDLNKYSTEAGSKVTQSADIFNEKTLLLRQTIQEASQAFTPIISNLNKYGDELKKIEVSLQKSDEKSLLVLSNTQKSAQEINLKIKEIGNVIKTYNEQAEKHDFVLKNRLEQTQSILDLQNKSFEQTDAFMKNQSAFVEEIKTGISEQTNALTSSENALKIHHKNIEKTFSKTNEQIKNIEETIQKNYDTILKKSEEALLKIKTLNEEIKETKTLSKDIQTPNDIAPKANNPETKTSVDLLQNASMILDKLQTFSIDMAHIFTPKAEDMLWKKYYDGDKAVFMRYITRMINETQHKQIKDLYLNNEDFNQAISRYMTEFEDMTKMVQNEDENKLLMSILIGSDVGRLYMVLADVLRRDNS
ncbi:MAG: hypothetical protein J6V53_02245 [Alphaproteobacteria bacterium]|nr:hypothetical protein [Alphaproteobacteria bacterium]